MILNVKVIPGAKKNLLKEGEDGIKVYLTSPPVDGKANEALVAFLAGHYGVRRSQIQIIKGLKSRNKVINIIS
jgi:uncharacterized protein (TIGR00251 family)